MLTMDRVSLYSPSCPGTHFVDQAGLRLGNLPASASQVLGLKACATTAWLDWLFTISRPLGTRISDMPSRLPSTYDCLQQTCLEHSHLLDYSHKVKYLICFPLFPSRREMYSCSNPVFPILKYHLHSDLLWQAPLSKPTLHGDLRVFHILMATDLS
jgi:hypothetical protein